jgi:hypothetical protein
MFSKCNNSQEAKVLFRKLAMRLHPDYGGSNEMMILLKDAYDAIIEYFKNEELESKKYKKKETEQKRFYEKVFEDIQSGDSRLKIIDEILDYAENNKNFKLDFTSSVVDYLEINTYITSGQYNRLVYIYYAFAMDKKGKNK